MLVYGYVDYLPVVVKCTYFFESLIDHIRLPEMIIREEIKLVEEVSDIDAA